MRQDANDDKPEINQRNKPTFNSIDENIVDLKNKLDSEDSYLFAAYK